MFFELKTYKFFQEGILALSRMEQQGLRIDMKYAEEKKLELTKEIEKLEVEFKETKLYKHWAHTTKNKVNIYSPQQLGAFLYGTKKIKISKETASGQGATDEEALQELGIPELDILLRIKKLKKVRDTYLDAFVREQVNGIVHPFFNLHLVRTFRGSSDSPNFQNIPKRDKETMEICRRAILPRPGHQFVELDYKQLEVRISCCYNRDEQLKEDILAGDMHKEMAIRIFHIEDFNKETTGHSVLRSATKNGFIFPQFYGDYYKNCAVNLSYGWGHLPKNRKWKSTDGIEFEDGKLGAHLISNGIKDLESFTQHIKVIEDYFWNVRYKDYTKWKERWWEQYQRVGHITSMTVFNYQGVMKKNDVLNYPIQGSAFHCLLWSIIQGIKVQVKEKWKSRLVSQIHDAIVMDVHPDELEHVVKTMKRIMCEDIVKHWSWITVPLDVDVEIHNVNDSWADKPQR